MANLVATADEYADAVISIMYANSLSYAVWHTPIGKYIKQVLQNNGITYDMLKEYWEILEPISQNRRSIEIVFYSLPDDMTNTSILKMP